MRFPPDTPAVVRDAVTRYVRTQRRVTLTAVVVTGLALAGLVVMAFMLVDRFVECPLWWRRSGPWSAFVVLVSTPVVALAARVVSWVRVRALSTAARLDLALPDNRDRWATAIDLAKRIDAGEHVGAQACVERLFAETEAHTTAAPVGRLVRRRGLVGAGVGLVTVGLLFAFVHASAGFDLPLLWQRFWWPTRNLPRDSFTKVVIREVNGQAYTDGPIAGVPEDSTFRLVVDVRRGGGIFDLFGSASADGADAGREPPELSILGDADTRRLEATRAGRSWRFTHPKLAERFRFCIRAGDALTRVYDQEVIPRIRVTRLVHSIRYPKYSRLSPVKRRELSAQRLSVLAESRIVFEVTCDQAYRSLSATFEAFQRTSTDAAPGAGGRVPGRPGQRSEPGRAEGRTHRRPLRVSAAGAHAGRFRLNVEESGVLRVRATGANGLDSREHTCVIEAVPDTPPRLVVTGLEPNTTIIPGELVAVRYRVEDDLAVSDIVMEWAVAGTFTGHEQFDYCGEEYIQSDDYGKKVVSGQEVIQRMNYKIYASSPFQFRFVAVDSKGQETRSPIFYVHIIDDDFAARFERGMAFLKALGRIAKSTRVRLSGIDNQLNVLTTATRGQKTWPASQDALLERLLKNASHLDHPYDQREMLVQRFGGLPYRLERSAVLLVGAFRMRLTPGDVLPLVKQLRAGGDLAGTLARIRAHVRQSLQRTKAWATAIDAEIGRFMPERIRQKARKLEHRFATLGVIRSNAELYAANLDFYLEELKKTVLDEGPLLVKARGELGPILTALTKAHARKKPEEVLPPLRAVIRVLSGQAPPRTKELDALMAALAAAATNDVMRDRLATVHGEVARSRGQETMLQAPALAALAGTNVAASAPKVGRWYAMPPAPGDVLLVLDQLRQALRSLRTDTLAGRYEMNPLAREDRASALREAALGALGVVRDCGALGKARRRQLVGVLEPASRGGLSPSALRPDGPLVRTLERAVADLGPACLKTFASSLPKGFARLGAMMRAMAKRYDQHARGVDAMLAHPKRLDEAYPCAPVLLREEAQRLWLQSGALEAYYRAVLLTVTPARLLGRAPRLAWSDWEPLLGLQLAMTEVVGQAEARVFARYVFDPRVEMAKRLKQYAVIATNARSLAGQLRTFAGLIEAVGQGRPVRYDFKGLMARAKTTGYLRSLKDEFAYIGPFITGADTKAMGEARQRLGKSFLGKVVATEAVLMRVLPRLERLRAVSGGKPAPIVAELKRLAPDLGAVDKGELRKEQARLVRVLSSGAPGKAVADAPVLSRQVSQFVKHLTEAAGTLRSMVQLPPVNVRRAENRRFSRQGGITTVWWSAADLLSKYDRRWLECMRRTELSLVRELVARADLGPRPTQSPRELVFQYARMLELRARNLANERRRNRGIPFLREDTGPSLRLPKHIAAEFFKARNRKSPEDFRARIEAYHGGLYRDLSD